MQTNLINNEDRKKLAQDEFDTLNKSVFKGGEGISLRNAIDLAERDEAKIIFVDCRGENEKLVSKVKGSVSCDEFESHLDKYDKQKDIIVPYCTIGLRSGCYCTKVKYHYQFQNVYNGNGIVLYSHEMPDGDKDECATMIVDKDGKPTKRIHVYGKRWTEWTHDTYTTVINSTLMEQVSSVIHLIFLFCAYLYHSRFFTR